MSWRPRPRTGPPCFTFGSSWLAVLSVPSTSPSLFLSSASCFRPYVLSLRSPVPWLSQLRIALGTSSIPPAVTNASCTSMFNQFLVLRLSLRYSLIVDLYLRYLGQVLRRAAQPTLGLRPLLPLRTSSGLHAPPREPLPHLYLVPCFSSRYPHSSDPTRLILSRLRRYYYPSHACSIPSVQHLQPNLLLRSCPCIPGPRSQLPSQFSVPQSQPVASLKIPAATPKTPVASPKTPVALPKVPSLLRSPRSKAPELKPSRRGMYAATLLRQAYLRRHSVLGSSSLDSPIPCFSPLVLVCSARYACEAVKSTLVLVLVGSSPRSSSRPQLRLRSSPYGPVLRPAHSSQLRFRSSPKGLRPPTWPIDLNPILDPVVLSTGLRPQIGLCSLTCWSRPQTRFAPPILSIALAMCVGLF